MADGALGDLAAAAERPGAVILARHGQPALSRRRMLCADEYREWWADYETGGLAEGQAPPDALRQAAERAGFIIASTRLRSVETARALACGPGLRRGRAVHRGAAAAAALAALAEAQPPHLGLRLAALLVVLRSSRPPGDAPPGGGPRRRGRQPAGRARGQRPGRAGGRARLLQRDDRAGARPSSDGAASRMAASATGPRGGSNCNSAEISRASPLARRCGARRP